MRDAESGSERGQHMAAEPNITGMARLLYVVAGVGLASWGLWGADEGWTQWAWLTLGGIVLILGAIGYSPIHAWLRRRNEKAA
jgi:hypothetical protein